MPQKEPSVLERLEALDDAAKDWGKLTRDQLRRRLMQLGVHSRVRAVQQEVQQLTGRRLSRSSVAKGILYDSIRYQIKRSYGAIDYIGIKFARQGIFIERGVGRGRPAGSPQAEAAKQQWLSIVLPQQIEVLANMLSEEYADIVAAEIKLVVPGIINTKIRGGNG